VADLRFDPESPDEIRLLRARASRGAKTRERRRLVARVCPQDLADETVIRARDEETQEEIAAAIALTRRREDPFAQRSRTRLRQGVDAPAPLAHVVDRRGGETLLLERGEDRVDLRAAELDEVADALLERGADRVPVQRARREETEDHVLERHRDRSLRSGVLREERAGIV